jgi:hypothetical protein
VKPGDSSPKVCKSKSKLQLKREERREKKL